jgi:hypothetical protein
MVTRYTQTRDTGNGSIMDSVDRNKDSSPENGDNSEFQEWARQFISKGLKRRLPEWKVRTIVETLRGNSGLSEYELYQHGHYRDGRVRKPICGKGTVEVYKKLYNEGKLDEYVARLDRFLGRSGANSQGDPKNSEEGVSDQVEVESWTPQALEVIIGPNFYGRILKPHKTASLLDPISIFISVTNHGGLVVRNLRLHVWLPRGYAFWNPEVTDSGGWSCLGPGVMPPNFQASRDPTGFDRYMLQMSPESGFFLNPSSLPFELPNLEIICKSILGMIPIPWQLEALDSGEVSGLLVLWVDNKGRVTSDSSVGDVVKYSLRGVERRFLESMGMTEDTRLPPIGDLMGHE